MFSTQEYFIIVESRFPQLLQQVLPYWAVDDRSALIREGC